MKILLRNIPPKSWKNMRNASRAFAKYLIPDEELIDSLIIKIVFVEDLDAEGFCEPLDFYEETTPLDYVIEIKDSFSEQEKIKILAHEFVHVKQYLMGELTSDHKSWKGVEVDTDDYDKQPWEIEAYALEESVFNAWKNV